MCGFAEAPRFGKKYTDIDPNDLDDKCPACMRCLVTKERGWPSVSPYTC